ncbi:MAG: HPr family phosphocarrier protein [Oscillospiraceae bacterium]|nr:HPr family phosphocarrier protein [Oscillospiraceae bacterium]
MVLRIRLRSFEDARALADLATAVPFRVWISDGRHWVDAKSLMCMFSLDLREPLTLRAECSVEAFEGLRALLGDFEI